MRRIVLMPPALLRQKRIDGLLGYFLDLKYQNTHHYTTNRLIIHINYRYEVCWACDPIISYALLPWHISQESKLFIMTRVMHHQLLRLPHASLNAREPTSSLESFPASSHTSTNALIPIPSPLTYIFIFASRA